MPVFKDKLPNLNNKARKQFLNFLEGMRLLDDDISLLEALKKYRPLHELNRHKLINGGVDLSLSVQFYIEEFKDGLRSSKLDFNDSELDFLRSLHLRSNFTIESLHENLPQDANHLKKILEFLLTKKIDNLLLLRNMLESELIKLKDIGIGYYVILLRLKSIVKNIEA